MVLKKILMGLFLSRNEASKTKRIYFLFNLDTEQKLLYNSDIIFCINYILIQIYMNRNVYTKGKKIYINM